MDACNWDLRRFRLVDINLHYKGALWADGTGIGHSFLHVWIESTVPCHRDDKERRGHQREQRNRGSRGPVHIKLRRKLRSAEMMRNFTIDAAEPLHRLFERYKHRWKWRWSLQARVGQLLHCTLCQQPLIYQCLHPVFHGGGSVVFSAGSQGHRRDEAERVVGHVACDEADSRIFRAQNEATQSIGWNPIKLHYKRNHKFDRHVTSSKGNPTC